MTRIWMCGLIPEAMAMGFSNILIPLFLVINLNGTLLDVGLLAGVSGLFLIPSLILWGWLADKFSQCKVFLVLSFAGMGITFFLMSFAKNFHELLILATVKSVFYAASLPTRQILTVESEGREGWEGGIARLEFLTGVGEAMGIALGVATTSIPGFERFFVLCGLLSFVSAIALITLIHETGLMIERRLMNIERFTNTLTKASSLISYADIYSCMGSSNRFSEIFKPSVRHFMLGVFTFSFAGNMLFTPLPIYFLNLYSTPTVFSLFFTNSAANTFSYLFVSRVAKSSGRVLIMTSISRIALIPLLVFPRTLSPYIGLTLAAAILALLGVIWALFEVSSTCLYLELSPLGRTGFYSALIGLGSAVGGFLGGYISMFYGFQTLFTICSLVYAVTSITFALQFRRWMGK